jgi:hypothetical protein
MTAFGRELLIDSRMDEAGKGRTVKPPNSARDYLNLVALRKGFRVFGQREIFA